MEVVVKIKGLETFYHVNDRFEKPLYKFFEAISEMSIK